MKISVLASAIIVSASAAFAGGPIYVPPPVIPLAAPVQQWTGPYAGLQLGFGQGEMVSQGGVELSGIVYGAHVGYNYDLGSIVLSAEADYNLADINGIFDGTAVIKTLAHLKARVGYDLGQTLIYGTGGLAYAEMDLFNGSSTYSGKGYFAGLGVDHKIAADWTAGAEYLYHQFEDLGGAAFLDINLHTVQARVSYHF
ncbi:MAG: outer membrane beta-barrel protein [Paracoccaceae bacterium]